MASTINADNGVVSGVSGINYTGDNSGVMALQTNGNTAVTIDSSRNVSLANNLTVTGNLTTTGYINAPNSFGFKNRIINGAMVIDQRNAGASITAVSTGYTFPVDRFSIYGSVSSKFTAQQNAGSVTPPAGFINYLGITSSSAYSVPAGELYLLRQVIEGLNITDLGWGTANAQTVTLSFWVRSSLTGTFGGSLRNSAADRSYPFSYTISSANTWEQKSITVAGDTSGTWLTTNGTGIALFFSLGSGSTFSGTAGAWAAADYRSATGAVSVVGTNGATFYITGVQLEKGSTATSFDYRPYGTELQLCQRYCQTISGVGNYSPITTTGSMATTTIARNGIPLLVTMRSSPSATFSAANTFLIQQNGGVNLTPSSIAGSSGGSNQSFYFIDFTVSGGTAGTAANAFDNNSTSAKITLTSEL